MSGARHTVSGQKTQPSRCYKYTFLTFPFGARKVGTEFLLVLMLIFILYHRLYIKREYLSTSSSKIFKNVDKYSLKWYIVNKERHFATKCVYFF